LNYDFSTGIEDSAMDLFGNFKTWISKGVLGFGKHEGKGHFLFISSWTTFTCSTKAIPGIYIPFFDWQQA
jgi:hypothetical protein